VSVEKVPGGGYKVRWRDRGRNRGRRFESKDAADRFDRKVKDLKAAGELHLLDEKPRGEITLRRYTRDVWWPEYAEVYLDRETRMTYAVQLDLRIEPKWGEHRLRDLRSGPIEAWAADLRRSGVGDATIIKTLTVMRSVLKRAVKDEEIERNPLVDVAKPKQARERSPKAIAPVYIELIRAQLLEPGERRDRRGRRIPERDALTRLQDATLVSVLAYSGPRPESEALPMRWDQVRDRTILYRATKSGKVVERTARLLGPLARDLAAYRLRRPPGAANGDQLVFGDPNGQVWDGHDWDNFRDRIFRPACEAVGLPWDTRPRDLRGSFASLLIYEGLNVVEVARQLGHSAATCLRDYASVFEEFDPAARRPAEEIIREARELVASTPRAALVKALRDGRVPAQYPRAAGDAE
jgi:site-specific recombinase XerC